VKRNWTLSVNHEVPRNEFLNELRGDGKGRVNRIAARGTQENEMVISSVRGQRGGGLIVNEFN